MKQNIRQAIKGPAWQWAEHEYQQGLKEIDAVYALRTAQEAKYGVGRLRIMVSKELRIKFDNQMRKFNNAINSGTLTELSTECRRAINALKAAEKEVTALCGLKREEKGGEEVGSATPLLCAGF